MEEVKNEKGDLSGVRIRVHGGFEDPRAVLYSFFRGMFEVGQLLHGKKVFSGLRAHIYAEKRLIQLTFGRLDA